MEGLRHSKQCKKSFLQLPMIKNGNGIGIKKQSGCKKRGVTMIKALLHRTIIYNTNSKNKIHWPIPSLWGRETRKETS